MRAAQTSGERRRAERHVAFAEGVCRALPDDATADGLGLRSTFSTRLVPAVRATFEALGKVRRRIGPLDQWVSQMGARYWAWNLRCGMSGGEELFPLPWSLEGRGRPVPLKARMDTAEQILREFSTFAVVGASRDPGKAAHGIPKQLAAAGFRIVPVNPHASGHLFGETVYPSLSAVPFPVEGVIVFRPSADAPAIAEAAVRIGARALWLQQGITSEVARRIAESAGLLYVEDRCTGVERALHRIVK